MRRALALIVVGTILPACAASDSRRPQLRALLDKAPHTLRESVPVAANAIGGDPVRATLVTAEPMFSIQVVTGSARSDVRISPMSGEVVATAAAGSGAFDCPDAIPLVDALGIAEEAAGGEAIQSVPDDDVHCAFEIQVLSGENLIEVKVAPDGAVLEKEPSDEFGGSEDD